MIICKEHVCVTHRHRQQCGGGQREGGQALGTGGQKGGSGDICTSVNNKNKNKKFYIKKYYFLSCNCRSAGGSLYLNWAPGDGWASGCTCSWVWLLCRLRLRRAYTCVHSGAQAEGAAASWGKFPWQRQRCRRASPDMQVYLKPPLAAHLAKISGVKASYTAKCNIKRSGKWTPILRLSGVNICWNITLSATVSEERQEWISRTIQIYLSSLHILALGANYPLSFH